MKCLFCGTTIRKNLTVQGAGIAIGMYGSDYSFCAKCLKSMTAYKFWKKMADEMGLYFPLHRAE